MTQQVEPIWGTERHAKITVGKTAKSFTGCKTHLRPARSLCH